MSGIYFDNIDKVIIEGLYNGIGMYPPLTQVRVGVAECVSSGVAPPGLVLALAELRDSDIATKPGCQMARVQPAVECACAQQY